MLCSKCNYDHSIIGDSEDAYRFIYCKSSTSMEDIEGFYNFEDIFLDDVPELVESNWSAEDTDG